MKRNVRGSVLNWKFSTKTGMADALYPGGLDKRDNQDTSARSLFETVQGINDVTDMFSNALGIKAPYLTIGEFRLKIG